MRLPLFVASFCFRKGEVGGERGLDAALALLNCDAAASVFDGENRNTNIMIHNTTPTIRVSGFVRRNDRTGPMAPLYCEEGCPQSTVLNFQQRICRFLSYEVWVC